MVLDFTDYALMRMRRRDILEEEVRQVLAASASKHTHRQDGRREVRDRVGRKVLLVVYTRRGERTTVINAMWET